MAESFPQVTIFKWFDVLLGICLQREQAYSIGLNNQSLYEMLAGGKNTKVFLSLLFSCVAYTKVVYSLHPFLGARLTFQPLSPTMMVLSFLSVPLLQWLPALTSITFISTFSFTLPKPYPCPTDFTMACFFFIN